MVEEFLRALDVAWRPDGPDRVRLRIIGSTALLLQSDYRRGTKDSDVLETAELAEGTSMRLLELGGVGTSLHQRYRLYIDVVGRAIPFLPEEPFWHPVEHLNATLSQFSIEVLDIVDVVVSKLWRHNSYDRDDISAMVERGLVPHERLVSRFQSAITRWEMDARSEDFPRAVERLNRLERDLLGVDESEIELPSWIGG